MEQSLIVRGHHKVSLRNWFVGIIRRTTIMQKYSSCIHFTGLSHGKRQTIFRRFKSNSCFENYGGVCTDQRVQELEAQVLDNHLEAIVAVGGGKVADLGKALAHKMALPVIILPTLAATCAPCAIECNVSRRWSNGTI